MLRVIGQDDPATVYTRKAKINLAPLLCNKGELSAQLTEGIKNETTFSHITGVCWRIKRSSVGCVAYGYAVFFIIYAPGAADPADRCGLRSQRSAFPRTGAFSLPGAFSSAGRYG